MWKVFCCKFSFANWHPESHSLWKLFADPAACYAGLLRRWLFRPGNDIIKQAYSWPKKRRGESYLIEDFIRVKMLQQEILK
jgi:hypothetical protein